ncbi:choice-of-anchor A family protein [Chthonomonas calidirosea]|uniref:choice-of-anchor A family protein n=1 Tax=Chthonomonas calidirosea TaxID=454171 RepID=UPI0006EC694F|nr:choice-of-anchor A family protein [Chthonomonas calidirosea]CEK19937.1 choice-of-anchor A domain [Chthonomonas calidirosea]
MLRKIALCVGTAAFCLCTHLLALAQTTTLDQALNYNLFLFSNGSLANTDVQGFAAIGGNLTVSSMGLGDSTYDSGKNSLVVAGNVSSSSSAINHGNGVIGGNLSGSLYDNDPNGHISSGVGNSTTALGIDFNAVKNNSTLQQNQLASLGNSPNATFSFNANRYDLNFTSATPVNGLYVYNLTQSQFNNFSTGAYLNILFSGSLPAHPILINVAGSSPQWNGIVEFNNQQFTQPTDAIHSYLLFNFYQANSLSLDQSIEGNLLATSANVTTSGYAHIGGSLIANSLQGTNNSPANFELHWNGQGFQIPHAATPETSSLAALAGLLFLGGTTVWAKRKKNLPRANDSSVASL